MRLLQIIVEGNCDMAVRQVASISFKNFIAKNWAPHDPGKFTDACTDGHCLSLFIGLWFF